MMQRARASASSLVFHAKTHWEKLQVEHHGEFPADHVKQFEEYAARTSVWRALLVCLWTPVPSIAVAVMMELNPLEDWTTRSIRQSPHFLVRCYVVLVILCVCYVEQFRQHIPSLQLSRQWQFLIALCGSTTALGVGFLLLDRVAYPFPFVINPIGMTFALVLIVMLRFAVRGQLTTNSRLSHDLRRHLLVCVCQVGMLTVYPLYTAAFVRVSSWGQTALVLVLAMIKLACKNWISRWIANSDEARPESVVFNVEVFHALYVSFSMQSRPAIHTMAAIMAVDFIQAWLSFHDLLRVVGTMKRGPIVVTGSFSDASKVVNRGQRQQLASVQVNPSTMQAPVPSTRVYPWPTTTSPAVRDAINRKAWSPEAVRPPVSVSPIQELNSDETATLALQNQKLLFMSESVGLVEYTEVLMPCIFNVYIAIMYYSSNRQYYDFLRDVSTDQLHQQITSVFLCASFEFVSLVIMAVILQRTLRLSHLHQIAFVLETRQVSIQAKVVLWAVTVLQSQISHNGLDYTFQFAWLKTKKSL